MSKKKDPYASVKAGIQAQAQILAGGRNSGYDHGMGVLDLIASNVGSSYAGLGSALTRSQARQLANVQKLAANTGKGVRRAVTRGAAQAAHNFGTAATLATGPAIAQGMAHAAGAGVAAKGSAKAGRTLQKEGGLIMGILGAGVAEAQANAQAGMAEAKLTRIHDDAAVIAAQQTQLMQMRLQAKLDYSTWKKQQDYLAQLETKDPASASGLVAIESSATTFSAWYREQLVDNPAMTPADAIAQYQAANGSFGDSELTVLTGVARAVAASVDDETGLTISGETRREEANHIVDSLILLYPEKAKHRDALLKSVMAQLSAQYGDMASRTVAPGPTGDQGPTIAGQPLPATREVGGTTYDTQTGYAVPAAPKGDQSQKAPEGGTGTTKSGRAYRVVGGNPYYLDTGYVVPANDRP